MELTEEQRRVIEARKAAALARRRAKDDEVETKRKALEQMFEDDDFEGSAQALEESSKHWGGPQRHGSQGFFKDTGAGFLMDEDEDEGGGAGGDGEGAARVLEAAYEDEPVPEMDQAPHVCLDCKKKFHESLLLRQFDHSVCNACRDMGKQKDGRYSLVTKSEAKEVYLLRDIDLDGKDQSLRFIEKKNPHYETWGKMHLYLRCQVEQRSFDKYGGEGGLEAEHDRRDEARSEKKQKKQVKQIKRLRQETAVVSKIANKVRHEHTFGDEEQIGDTDEWRKACTECGFEVVFEKM